MLNAALVLVQPLNFGSQDIIMSSHRGDVFSSSCVLVVAGVSSVLSVEVVGPLRRNYDSSGAAAAVSDAEEVQGEAGNGDIDLSGKKNDEFDHDNGKHSVFASNGDLLLNPDGSCTNRAINPEDGCWKCAPADYFDVGSPGFGFGNPGAGRTDMCTACPANTSSEIVDGKSQCVCDNGATDPWPSTVSFSQCQACPAGETYVGPIDADGAGECI
eukprot:scaffold37431_cov228-Skeletonema_dohrnii-CCMP3373.AAC.1